MVPEGMVISSSDSPFARQKQNGYSNLRFESSLESQFSERYIDSNLSKLRWSVCVAIILFIVFAVLDAYLLTVDVAVWGTAIRGIVVMLLGFNLFASFVPNLRPYLQVITMISCIVAGVGVILIIYIAQYYGANIPFTGMMLIVSVFYFLSGLLFRKALLAGFATLVVYVLLGLVFDSPVVDIIYNSSFLIAANLIGCVGCYSYEYAARTNFLVHSMLNNYAERDALTGLFNRRAFDKYFGRLWRLSTRKQTSLAIAMIDVDHFKLYNDQYGHQMGDLALKRVAEVLSRYFQRSTDLIARYGGEEFIGVLSDISIDEAYEILEKIRLEIETSLAIPQAEGLEQSVITVSIGLSQAVPEFAQNRAEQIEKSDKALYIAKARGRNQVMVE